MKHWFVVTVEYNNRNGRWYPDNFVITEHPVLYASTRDVFLVYFTEIEQEVADQWIQRKE